MTGKRTLLVMLGVIVVAFVVWVVGNAVTDGDDGDAEGDQIEDVEDIDVLPPELPGSTPGTDGGTTDTDRSGSDASGTTHELAAAAVPSKATPGLTHAAFAPATRHAG